MPAPKKPILESFLVYMASTIIPIQLTTTLNDWIETHESVIEAAGDSFNLTALSNDIQYFIEISKFFSQLIISAREDGSIFVPNPNRSLLRQRMHLQKLSHLDVFTTLQNATGPKGIIGESDAESTERAEKKMLNGRCASIFKRFIIRLQDTFTTHPELLTISFNAELLSYLPSSNPFRFLATVLDHSYLHPIIYNNSGKSPYDSSSPIDCLEGRRSSTHKGTSPINRCNSPGDPRNHSFLGQPPLGDTSPIFSDAPEVRFPPPPSLPQPTVVRGPLPLLVLPPVDYPPPEAILNDPRMHLPHSHQSLNKTTL